MANLKQKADGSLEIQRRDGGISTRAGAIAGPAGSNTPGFDGSSTLVFNIAGGTDTAGGLLGWKNTLGYDIIVTSAVLSVTTIATGACTVSIGETATNATTSASNLISGQDTHSATGEFTSTAPVSVRVPAGKWLTGSVASGAGAGMVGKVYLGYQPA